MTTTKTVTDAMGAEAPAEYDNRDLMGKGCPCGCMQFEQFPAGHYHCTDCWSAWAGDPEDANLVHYFEPSGED